VSPRERLENIPVRSAAAAPREAGDAMISDVDKRRIAEAIRAAEEKIAGEIFCVIAHACGNYRLVPIAWAALVALAVPLPLIYLTARPAGIIYLLQLAAFIVVALVLSLPMIRFRIVPKRRLWGRAHAEAMYQFLAHGIHLTEHRTGVLIFASVAEHYAEIVADSGINAKVQPGVLMRPIATQGHLSDEICTAGLFRRKFPWVH
jgi:putative membrane protein